MNSENCKTSASQRLLLNLTVKINLKRTDKYAVLWNLSIYDTWKNKFIQKQFQMSAPTWNEKFGLPDGSCFVSDIQDYLNYIIKKHENSDRWPFN